MSSRNTASIQLRSVDGQYIPKPGDTVSVEDDAPTVWFSGTVDSVDSTWHNPSTFIDHSIVAVGYDQIAARRVCWEARHWENTKAGDIFRAMVTAFLGGENVDVGEVIDGPSIAVFDAQAGATVYSVFDSLAEAAGLHWDMVGTVGNPVARLYQRATYPASTQLTASMVMAPSGEIRMSSDRRDLANRIWVRTRAGAGQQVSEEFVGDGSARDFVVSRTIAGWPLVTVNGEGKTVQLRDGGESGQWYFTPGSAIITQDPAETVLGSGDQMIVDYAPQVEAIEMLAEDAADIAARDTQEATSGKYEVLIDAVDAASAQAGLAKANAELARRKPAIAGDPLNRRLTIRTRAANDYAAGKTLSLPEELRTPLGLSNGTWLIEECERSSQATTAGHEWWVTSTAVSEQPSGDWRAHLATLSRPVAGGGSSTPSAGQLQAVVIAYA